MIKEIQDKQKWEEFLAECDEKTFLQAWNWGEFNKLMGKKIWRIGIYDNNELLAACLAIKILKKKS
jgi:lipid II:glycine glycyltransferase (peptidoglycan interpeptide bridge formation enzyme)